MQMKSEGFYADKK